MHRTLPRFIRFIEGTEPNPAGSGSDPASAEDPQPDLSKSEDPAPKEDEKLGEGGLKALQAERAARAAAEKRANDAQAALDAERNAAAVARQEADAAKVEALKYQVAVEQGVPVSLAGRLVGTTREELEADAKTVKASLTPTFVPPTDPSQGKDQGGKGGGTVEAGKELYERMHGKKNKK